MRFLFVDRILDLSPGKSIRGLKHITYDDVFLSFDSQGNLCFTPSLIGETLGQLAAWNVMYSNNFTKRPVAGIVSSAKLLRSVYIGDTIFLESIIEHLDDEAVQYRSIATVAGEEVFSIEGALGPLLPMDDFIDAELIKNQFDEIYRPGNFSPTEDALYELIKDSNRQVITPHFSFDKVLSYEAGVYLKAQKNITRAAAYFNDHFPKKPVLPMTVLLECKINLISYFLSLSDSKPSFKLQELRKIKMNDFVSPGDVVTTELRVKEHSEEKLIINFRSEVDGKRVCVLEAFLTATRGKNE